MQATLANAHFDFSTDRGRDCEADDEVDASLVDTGEWQIGLKAAAEIECEEDLATFVGACRRKLIRAGTPLHDVFHVASALTATGATLLAEVGPLGLAIELSDGCEVEIRAHEPTRRRGLRWKPCGLESRKGMRQDRSPGARWARLGQVVGALTPEMRSVQVLQRGRADGLRVRATLRLDTAGAV